MQTTSIGLIGLLGLGAIWMGVLTWRLEEIIADLAEVRRELARLKAGQA